MVDLEQSGNQIPDAWSTNDSYIFINTNLENRKQSRTKKQNKKSLKQLSYYYFE